MLKRSTDYSIQKSLHDSCHMPNRVSKFHSLADMESGEKLESKIEKLSAMLTILLMVAFLRRQLRLAPKTQSNCNCYVSSVALG